ncbi:unnamed protein product [Ambrosiozyma monospora]|uniref:Unnamed protein product n=1 Tax=Ambrosiozyma monospora TaxID=43982 RepID=A0ACB5U985_AMBMO|nr:unnamed protein product [Ambrosiozyma monospora]
MNMIATQINMDPRLTALGLLNLRLQTQLCELSSMLNAAGWINIESIRLNQHEMSKLDIDYDSLKQKNLVGQLFNLKFYRRKDWPIGWFLTVGVSGYSSNVQWWCSRIKSYAGQWSLSWCESVKLPLTNSRETGDVH